MSYDEDERNGDFKLYTINWVFFVKITKNMPIIIRVIMAINHTALRWLELKSA